MCFEFECRARQRTNAKGAEHAILMALCSMVNRDRKDGRIWPKVRTICEWSGYSSATVRRALKRLDERREIRIVSNGQGRAKPLFEICIGFEEWDKGAVAAVKAGRERSPKPEPEQEERAVKVLTVSSLSAHSDRAKCSERADSKGTDNRTENRTEKGRGSARADAPATPPPRRVTSPVQDSLLSDTPEQPAPKTRQRKSMETRKQLRDDWEPPADLVERVQTELVAMQIDRGRDQELARWTIEFRRWFCKGGKGASKRKTLVEWGVRWAQWITDNANDPRKRGDFNSNQQSKGYSNGESTRGTAAAAEAVRRRRAERRAHADDRDGSSQATRANGFQRYHDVSPAGASEAESIDVPFAVGA